MHRTGYTLIVLSLLIVQVAHAQNAAPKATNYVMPTDVQAVGGGEKAKSTSYELDDTIGEANIGAGRSTSYDLNAGYRQAGGGNTVSLSCDDTAAMSITFTGQANANASCTVTSDSDAGYSLSWRAGTSNSHGLIGHWKMDETSGTDVYDSSGNNYTGTNTNGAAIVSTVPNEYMSTRALAFNGSTTYVTAGDIFDSMQSFTLSTWVYPQGINTLGNSFDTIVSKSGFGADWDLLINTANSNKFAFYITTTGAGDKNVQANTSAQNHQWHHVTVSWDQSTGILRMYVNGKYENRTTGVTGDRITNNNNFCIGKSCFFDNRLFNGVIDDVRVYDRVLNDAEIRDLASKAAPGALVQSGSQVTNISPFGMPFTGGLVGHWKMDEPVAGTVADSSGQRRDGTPTGASGGNNKPVVSTELPSSINFSTSRSLDFDGTDDYVDINSGLGISAYPVTMCSWMKPDATTDGLTFTSLNVSGASDQYLALEIRDGKASIAAQNTTFQNAVGTTDISAGTWYHVCGVYESATSKKLYVNGALENTLATSVAIPSVNKFFIGKLRSTDDVGAFDGDIDDVRVYRRVLTDAEIAIIYGTPQTWTVGNTDSRWGARLSSTSTDTDAKWGTDNSTDKWINVGEGSYPLVTRSSATAIAGSTEVINFRTEIGANKIQVPGIYTASVVMTAAAL